LAAKAQWANRAPYNKVLTVEHAELAAGFSGQWSLWLQDVDYGTPFPPRWALSYAGHNARRVWPGGAAWSFFAAPGATVWILPQTQDPARLYLGFSTESLPGNFFDSYFNADPRVNRSGRWVTWALVGLSGPGELAVWQTDSFGNPTAWMTTKDGITAQDAFYQLEAGHSHVNWGFTRPGLYFATFQVSARKNGQTVTSHPVTFHFGVEARGVETARTDVQAP
jgi:surface-anchored protein